MSTHAVVPSVAEIESALLGVLLSAENARDGATAVLAALRPALDECPAAVALRDRDGLRLHVLAEHGGPCGWPQSIAPQCAVAAQPAVDAVTGALVVPLRASGRVVGALLLADSMRGAELLDRDPMRGLLDTTAAVLHALASRLDGELRRRADDLRSIGSIIEGVAHQIANPLTGASAIAQLLVDDVEDGQRAAVNQIRQELSRAFIVLRDLLEFQRDTHAQDGILDLNALVERLVRFRGYAIREQGISVDVDLGAGFMGVRADVRGLEHAVLIALRHAELRSHGTVNRGIGVAVVERGPRELAVEITDSGTGEIPEIDPGFFDLPFRRDSLMEGDRERPDLGLVDSILRSSGGRLELRGSKATGTTLTLVLPRADTLSHGPVNRIPS